MPRPLPPDGVPRRNVPLRLSRDEEAPVRRYADEETGGNLSDMIRKLVAEAVDAREKRTG